MRNNDSSVKNILQGKVMMIVILGIIIIFATVVALALNIIGTHLVDEADARYAVIADNVAEEITTWFSNESQIVLNQKAAIEISGNFDNKVLTDYLTKIVSDYNPDGYIYDLYFLDVNNVMSSGYGYVPEPSIDFRERSWYTEAVARNGIYYATPYKDTNLDRYVVTISTPCYNKDGEMAGVLALDIFVDTLFAIADNKVIDGNSYVFLVDNDLDIVTHPNEKFGYVDDEPIKLTDVDDNIYKYLVGTIYGLYNNGKYDSHYNIRDYDGVDRAVYVSRIDCCGWYVVAAIESAVFYAPLEKTIMVVVLALIICLVIGVIITRLFTARIIAQLNEANEAALIANEAKGTFLANMSHEIRTPINAIIGMNEMVLRENNDPVINDYALDIASASRSLVTIVNDILDFSKIESGKMEILEAEFNIASLINDVVNMSESRLAGRNIVLFFDVDPTLPIGIVGDEMRIKQVVLNIITNAIKYTDEGFVTLKVEYTKQDYGINLNFSVRDSGIGISEENLGQLFQSFERFDTKRNRAIEGTGLGLSITKRLVQNMGGFINVYSKLGEGSEFTVSIPLKVTDCSPFITIENTDSMKFALLAESDRWNEKLSAEMEKIVKRISVKLNMEMIFCQSFDEFRKLISEDNSITHIVTDRINLNKNRSYYEQLSQERNVIQLRKRGSADELPSHVQPMFIPFYSMSLATLLNSKKQVSEIISNEMFNFEAPEARVLIVDDNSMNLKVAAGLIKPYKIRVTTASNGMDAIEILEKDKSFDIVFMDHMMPVMDGVEATAKIRELSGEYYKKLPVVALTANTINNARSMFLSSGFDDFLAKPINVNMLDKILRTYIPKEKMLEIESPSLTKKEDVASINIDSSPKAYDPNIGLKYSAGNKELYLEILKEYVSKASANREGLETSFIEKDWANYVIKAHALKSTSMTIGAAPLSELAKTLELGGKAGNYELIISKHSELLEKYQEIIKETEKYLNDNGVFIRKENVEEAEITEMVVDRDRVFGYVLQFKEALSELDADKAEDIYLKACEAGDEYKKLFEKTLEYIRDYEYEKAEQELERINK